VALCVAPAPLSIDFPCPHPSPSSPETGLHAQPIFHLKEKTMTKLHAQPYGTSAVGFYFEDYQEYQDRAAKLRNDYGDPVEEFEIQFIDGDHIDCDLATAWTLYQSNIEAFFDAVNNWNERQKAHYIIAVGECGYAHEQVADDPENMDITIYQLCSMRELAEQFVDEGLFGDIPEFNIIGNSALTEIDNLCQFLS
jgi:hypothetical protein